VGPINQAAVAVARQAAGDEILVVGSIGSIIAGRVRTAPLNFLRAQYEEQASALLQAGVDGIMLETFQDLEELLLALDVIRGLTELPIIAQLATLEVGRTRDGYTVSDAFRYLQQARADVVGLNCRLGPAEMLRTLENTITPLELPLSVFANAGRLGISDGELAYKSSPDYFAESALRLRNQGVRLIGGCCGTTPEHIRAMVKALDGLGPLPRVNPDVKVGAENPPLRPALNMAIGPTRESIIDLVKKRPTVLVEFDPPKDLDVSKFLKGCVELHQSGADAITIADNSLANVRMSNLALGSLLKNKYGIDPLLHVACRDRNLIGQQSHLMGLQALGIDQILVITGDPSRFGDLPGSSAVFDVNSFDLIRMTKQLNEGISFSGRPLKQKANFIVGTAFNPHVRQIETSIKRLEKKVESGADYVMTQPVYDAESIEKTYQATKHLAIPIFIGIMPLTSQRNAEFLHNEVPGIKLSPGALSRMQGLQGLEARQEGIKMAKELIDVAMLYFNGIYLITPFNYYDMTVELTKYVQEKTRKVKDSIYDAGVFG